MAVAEHPVSVEEGRLVDGRLGMTLIPTVLALLRARGLLRPLTVAAVAARLRMTPDRRLLPDAGAEGETATTTTTTAGGAAVTIATETAVGLVVGVVGIARAMRLRLQDRILTPPGPL